GAGVPCARHALDRTAGAWHVRPLPVAGRASVPRPTVDCKSAFPHGITTIPRGTGVGFRGGPLPHGNRTPCPSDRRGQGRGGVRDDRLPRAERQGPDPGGNASARARTGNGDALPAEPGGPPPGGRAL